MVVVVLKVALARLEDEWLRLQSKSEFNRLPLSSMYWGNPLVERRNCIENSWILLRPSFLRGRRSGGEMEKKIHMCVFISVLVVADIGHCFAAVAVPCQALSRDKKGNKEIK